MKKLATRLLIVLVLIGSVLPASMAATASEPVPASAPATSEPDPNAVKDAMNEFKHLSRSERRHRLKDARKAFKEYRAAKRAGNKAEADMVLLVILAILLPPLAVYLKEGEINGKFWLSVLLTLLFWLPGIIYAMLVIFDEV
jgi:uncharacterized membrane protein YqaE (UPF0057 family)